MHNVEEILRSLAKSTKYQVIFNASKEIGLKIFKNDTDFTALQILFLQFLFFYNSLYMDVAMDDVDEMVLEKFLYEDCYSLYKNKKKEKKDTVSEQKKDKKNSDKITKSQWVFRKK